MLRAQPLGDVVDEDQARGAAAPAHQVAHASISIGSAAPLHVAEYAAVQPTRIRGAGTGGTLAILGNGRYPPPASSGIPGASSRTGGLPPHSPRENAGLGVEYPHRQRAALEQHAIAALLGIDPVHQPLQRRRKHTRQRHKGEWYRWRAPNPNGRRA